jgi:hypothetical protein
VFELLRPPRVDPVEPGASASTASEEPFALEAAPVPAPRWFSPSASAVRGAWEGWSETARTPAGSLADAIRTEPEGSNGGRVIRFFGHAPVDTAENRLRRSMAALGKLAASPEPVPEEWLEAAAILKRDAVRLRNTSQARHASVLLILADALTFTAPSAPTLENGALKVFQRGLALLTDPFISQEAEESLDIELISSGWNLAPASTGEPLAP